MTVFAPDNDALTAVDIEALSVAEAIAIVNDHVITSEPLYADDVQNGLVVLNANDNELIFGNGTVKYYSN